MVAKFTDMTFSSSGVVLDDCEFRNCTFHDCKLIYSGGTPPTLDTCEFQNSEFKFEGPAANTVAFLKAMTAPGSGLQKVIQGTFPARYGN